MPIGQPIPGTLPLFPGAGLACDNPRRRNVHHQQSRGIGGLVKLGLSSAIFVLFAFGGNLPANAVTLGGGGDPRPVDLSQTFDIASDRAVESKTYVVTAGSGKFEKMRRVAILNFCSQFMFSKSALGASSGSSITYTRASEGGIPLDLDRMTAVADGLYERIEAGLRAAGLEVVPYETLSSLPAFQKYARNYVTGPQEMDIGGKSDRNSVVEGRAVVISAKGRPFSTDCRVQSPSQTGDRIQLSYQLKDIYLLSVNTLIDFASATAKGGLLSGARAKLDYGQYVVPGATQYHFTGIMQPMYVNVWLKQAIVAADSPLAVGRVEQTEVEREASIDGSQGSRTTTTTSEVGFDADLYYSNAASYLEAANDMFLEVLKSK
jgi:hypothetical protein